MRIHRVCLAAKESSKGPGKMVKYECLRTKGVLELLKSRLCINMLMFRTESSVKAVGSRTWRLRPVVPEHCLVFGNDNQRGDLLGVLLRDNFF